MQATTMSLSGKALCSLEGGAGMSLSGEGSRSMVPGDGELERVVHYGKPG